MSYKLYILIRSLEIKNKYLEKHIEVHLSIFKREETGGKNLQNKNGNDIITSTVLNIISAKITSLEHQAK
jgi:hypothetical protein